MRINSIVVFTAVALAGSMIYPGAVRAQETLEAVECNGRVADAGVPEPVRGNLIWGIYANAIQLETTFSHLVCSLTHDGTREVTYLKPSNGTRNHGLQIDHQGDILKMRFVPVPDAPAWVLQRMTANGAPQQLSNKDKLMILRVFVSQG